MKKIVYEFEDGGKKYIAIEKGLEVYIRYLTWILTIILIGALVDNAYVYYTHIDEMRTDAITYGIRQGSYDYCNCYSKGNLIQYQNDRWFDANYSKIKEGELNKVNNGSAGSS